MRSLLIDVEKAEVKEIEVKGIDDFHKHINCTCIDIAGRYIGAENRWYDIVIDDNGALKENAIVSAINEIEIMLFGNLVITKSNEVGEQIPLSNYDIDYLHKYIRTGYKLTENNLQMYPILVDVHCFKDEVNECYSKKLNTEKHEIVIKIYAGVFYIYIDKQFHCSCESWEECRTEIGVWIYENVK